MTETCPMCREGELAAAEGRLEQSGDSYLPTTVWSCGTCGYTRYAPALHARWRRLGEEAGRVEPVEPGRRAA